jgi:probable HAF family extracellular repeat protein
MSVIACFRHLRPEILILLCKNLHLDPRPILAQHVCELDFKQDCAMNKIILAALALAFVQAAAAQSYTITALGVVRGGLYSDPYAMNDQGAVAGTASLVDGHQHAFVWTKNTGARDLGTLVGHNAYSTARGINNSGQVVGLSYLSDEITYRAFLYTQKDGMRDLGTLGGDSSAAYGINNTGQVVGEADLSSIATHAFLWTASAGMQDLGSLGGNTSAAYGINEAGDIVGFSYLRDNFTVHAFLWTEAAGMQDLGDFNGDGSIANAINASGQIVGIGYLRPDQEGLIAALWTSTHKMQSLGTATESDAVGINDSGQIVGYYGAAAFLWTAANHLQDLNTLIPPNSGWTLVEAAAINRSGQIAVSGIVGIKFHGALLTPKNQLSRSIGKSKFSDGTIGDKSPL